MTRIPQLLGSEYDALAVLPDDAGMYHSKRNIALAGLRRAEKDRDNEGARVLLWELGIHDLVLVPADGMSSYRGAPYEKYAEHYGFNEETIKYAEERAAETLDVMLELRYQAFVSLRSAGSGRDWLERQRKQLETFRRYIDRTLAAISSDSEFVGVYIDTALAGLGRIASQGGVVATGDAPDLARWIVDVAERSRDFPVRDPRLRDYQRHRWVADYLLHLLDLPPDSIEEDLRRRALQMLEDAATCYANEPLSDHFSMVVAEADASLRKYFGQSGTHERMIRAQLSALEKRAEFHRGGSELLTAAFYRKAHELMSQHRQYFTDEVVDRLARAEQTALDKAVTNDEFAQISVPMFIPQEHMDFTGDSASETVSNIVRESVASVPRYAELEGDAAALAEETPLHAAIPRSVVGRGKVVGEAHSEEANLALDVEGRVVLMARLLGAAIATTVATAKTKHGIAASDLIEPLKPLRADAGTLQLLEHGVERYLADDFISAAHVLVPRIEDVLRQQLRELGANTTTLKRGQGRTDDATLNTLLGSTLADGRSVREWMGDDLWRYFDAVYASQTGLNLRHEFAHGLARPGHCAPDIVSLVLSLLYILAWQGGETTPAAATE